MSHVRNLSFDALEGRLLLSTAHAARPHTTPARIVSTPLSLDGTLTVDNAATYTTTNMDGSTTTSTPVAGNLGSLGKLRGVWNESTDQFGDATGADIVRLANKQGTLVIVFANTTPGPAHAEGHGAVFYEHAQQLFQGTGAYAHNIETGSIELITNNARSAIVSMALKSQTA